MKTLWILSFFLLSLLDVFVDGKTISKGITYESLHGKTFQRLNFFAAHHTFSEIYLSNSYRIAKFQSDPLKYYDEVDGLTGSNLLVLSNNVKSYLLNVQGPNNFEVYDLSLSKVDISSWNFPVFRDASCIVHEDKLYVCDRIPTEISENPFLVFSVTTYNSSFYFQEKQVIGNRSFTGQTYSCGQMAVDHKNGKVWSLLPFVKEPLEGRSLYLLANPLKKVILKIPFDQKITSIDIHDNVVALSTSGVDSSLYVFDLPESFVDGQVIDYSAKTTIEFRGSIVLIHDSNGEIYQKEYYTEVFSIYRRSKNTLKVVDTYTLPHSLDTSFYAMSILPSNTHGYLLGNEYVFKFPIPRYDETSLGSVLNLPSFISLSLLICLLFLLV